VDRQAFGAVRLTLPGNSSSRSEWGQRDFRFLGVNELEVLRKGKRITTPIELQEVTALQQLCRTGKVVASPLVSAESDGSAS
jgi:hypothetical protein